MRTFDIFQERQNSKAGNNKKSFISPRNAYGVSKAAEFHIADVASNNGTMIFYPVLFNHESGFRSKKFFTLNTIPFKEIDMLSIIIIGNSQTTLVDEIFLTPRGYLQN